MFLLLFSIALASQPPSLYLQLSGKVNTGVNAQVYDFDLEDHESDGLIAQMKSKGKTVVCYFSAGTYENWRSDAKSFPRSVLGNNLDEWPGEKWLDIRSQAVKDIMVKRLDRAKAAGCDGVDPDNLDGYSNNPGFKLTVKDQVAYLRWLVKEAHDRNLKVGLKNTGDLVVPYKLYEIFDWALNEQCYQYSECSPFKKFIEAGKPVWIVEYKSKSESWCKDAKKNGFHLAFYSLSLNGSKYQPCQ